ncbi:hypothetical protein Leryth_003215 [Lithospermum erythrorhizon]|nr:hypothetical protein Leryth_003215 [Lithospermum erythrorhizon]
MSSELFIFEDSRFSDPFSPFSDSCTIDHQQHDDIFQVLEQNYPVQDCEQPRVDDSNSFDQIASFLLSPSPPSHQLENLSICQSSTQLQNDTSSDSLYAELPPLDIKTEDLHVPLDYGSYTNPFETCYGSLGTPKLMQRSYSSNSFVIKPNLMFQPGFDSLMESPNLQNQLVGSPKSSSFSSNQMRRVCSTGDLHKMKTVATRNVLSSLSTERSSFIEEAGNNKVGRYSSEERKERIDRYKSKRTQRNFNKTIKYACRKTLADTRPRIRGRFARNDEPGDLPKTTMFNDCRFVDDEVFRVDGLHEEEYGSMMMAKTPFINNFSATQEYQYFSYPR